MSRKHEKVCTNLNYIEHFPILTSKIRLKIWATAGGIEKYKSVIKKKKKHDKIVLLAKYILNSIKVLMSKALIDSFISHDEFV